MSAAEIQTLCELYIGRKFDENDSAALREFLRDLQVQKPKKVKEEKEEAPKEKKFVPVSERKQYLGPKEVAAGDRPAPVSLAELGATGNAKDRAAAYTQTIHGSGGGATSPRKPQDLEIAGFAKVSERKQQWADGVSTSPRSQEVVKERLADVSGAPGVKDRLGAWNNVTSGSAEKSHTDERLAEVKGAPGVKDRLGNWQNVAEHAGQSSNSAARVEEVKGAPGVKDRLGNWNQVVANADKGTESKTTERLAELGAPVGVKSRTQGWQETAEKDTVITSTGANLAEERTSDLKKAPSVRDRLTSYSKAASETKVEKVPIHIPQDVSELPTRDTQGQ